MRIVGILVAAVLLLGASAAQAVVTTIYNIQLGYHALEEEVTVENVVVTATGRFGFFVQEQDPHPTWDRMYSGIWVYCNDAHLGQVRRGDLVNVTGAYAEYYDFSEIDIYHSPCGDEYECGFEVVGTAEVPDPVVLRIADVNDTGAYSEAYESVLIRVDAEDPTLFSREPNQYDDWYLATDPVPQVGDSIVVDSYSADPDGDFDYPLPDEGTELEYVQGILVYNYDQYKIAPRNCPEDLGMPCPPELRGLWAYDNQRIDVLFAVDVDEASAEDEFNYYFLSGLAVLDAQRDESNHRLVHLTTEMQTPGSVDVGYVEGVLSEDDLVMMDPAEFTFTQGITSIYDLQYTDDLLVDESAYLDLVVTTAGRVSHVAGNYYYLQEDDGGEFEHIYGRVAKVGDLAEGDSIKFAGRVSEYFGETYVSWTAGVQLWENLGPATGAVVTRDLPPETLIYDCAQTDNRAEPWEHALVHIAPDPFVPAYVDSVEGEAELYGEWWLLYDAPPYLALEDSCRTDLTHELNDFSLSYNPNVGDSLDISGILRYEYDLYRVVPRSDDDVVVVYGGAVEEALPQIGRVRLEQNRPNPFGQRTVISFRLEQEARDVSVEVYDVTGACVRHLLRGVALPAGPHSLQWDGLDDEAVPLATGTYFYRLTVDGRSQARQMIRLQ
ncbi:MAG: hypothetical protein GF330_03905 [Candidatus Eisenbacteria bacterium]|nr:hypothetical protein [Candidatus Eisenbacteria bacterium]